MFVVKTSVKKLVSRIYKLFFQLNKRTNIPIKMINPITGISQNICRNDQNTYKTLTLFMKEMQNKTEYYLAIKPNKLLI